MPAAPRFRIKSRMSARDTDEEGRVSSPIELLFDLTFVVAIAQIADELASNILDGKSATAIVPFLMVFFAIWWAWMNFTWFASAYDTDDVPYRLLTLLQMGGVLVLAAGVPLAFDKQNFIGITLGYFIMRIALVAQWVRAGVENPEGRLTAFRYAGAIVVVQAGWLLRLLLPTTPEAVPYTVYLAFVVLAALELWVPTFAERRGKTAWHPHHIAERYGLFTIILLGESIAALAGGVQLILRAGAPTASLVSVGVASLALVFALWWMYFMQPAGDGLERHRDRSYIWGYAHYFVFGALAALGGGLEVVIHVTGSGSHVDAGPATYAVSIPVAIYLVSLWASHVTIVPHIVVPLSFVIPSAALVLLIPLTADAVGVPVALAAVAVVVVATLGAVIVRKTLIVHRETA